MAGGGLLCLVRQVTVSSLFSVTVNSPPVCTETPEDWMEIEEGGTEEDGGYFSRYDYNDLPCTVRRAGLDTRASCKVILLSVT